MGHAHTLACLPRSKRLLLVSLVKEIYLWISLPALAILFLSHFLSQILLLENKPKWDQILLIQKSWSEEQRGKDALPCDDDLHFGYGGACYNRRSRDNCKHGKNA